MSSDEVNMTDTRKAFEALLVRGLDAPPRMYVHTPLDFALERVWYEKLESEAKADTAWR